MLAAFGAVCAAVAVDYLVNDLSVTRHPNYKTHHSNSEAFPLRLHGAAVVAVLAAAVPMAPSDSSSDIGSGIDNDSTERNNSSLYIYALF